MNYSEFELSPPKLILNALPIISASPVLSLIELTLSSRVWAISAAVENILGISYDSCSGWSKIFCWVNTGEFYPDGEDEEVSDI